MLLTHSNCFITVQKIAIQQFLIIKEQFLDNGIWLRFLPVYGRNRSFVQHKNDIL
jgi:hypothetical protein